jgi:hypothetical protein
MSESAPPRGEISTEIRQFIFNNIDSVEQLEVLILLRRSPAREWTAREISNELRSLPQSVELRLAALYAIGLVATSEGTPTIYRYGGENEATNSLIDALINEYKLRPQRVMELIFSPLKKARHFADAFVMTKGPQKKGEDNG